MNRREIRKQVVFAYGQDCWRDAGRLCGPSMMFSGHASRRLRFVCKADASVARSAVYSVG